MKYYYGHSRVLYRLSRCETAIDLFLPSDMRWARVNLRSQTTEPPLRTTHYHDVETLLNMHSNDPVAIRDIVEVLV